MTTDTIQTFAGANYKPTARYWAGTSVDRDRLWGAYFFGSGYPGSALRAGYNYANWWDGVGAFPSQARDVALQGAVGATYLAGDQANYYQAPYTGADIAAVSTSVTLWAVCRLPNTDAYVIDGYANTTTPGIWMERNTDGTVRIGLYKGDGGSAKVAKVNAWANIATKWALIVGVWTPTGMTIFVRTADGPLTATIALDGTYPFTSTRGLRFGATQSTSAHLAVKDLAGGGVSTKALDSAGVDAHQAQLKAFFATYGGPPNIVADLG